MWLSNGKWKISLREEFSRVFTGKYHRRMRIMLQHTLRDNSLFSRQNWVIYYAYSKEFQWEGGIINNCANPPHVYMLILKLFAREYPLLVARRSLIRRGFVYGGKVWTRDEAVTGYRRRRRRWRRRNLLVLPWRCSFAERFIRRMCVEGWK